VRLPSLLETWRDDKETGWEGKKKNKKKQKEDENIQGTNWLGTVGTAS
jgi:hypothetical protein